MDPLAPGQELGKYRVVRRLATGGMAEIYLAQARGLQGFSKYVVLKRILPQFAASETFVKLFVNEARVTATLDHPNIASVHDIGSTEGGAYFFTMEYLHGEDLGKVLRKLVGSGLRLPLEHALTIGAGVAAGLHAAHEKRGSDGKPLGIVHRDISPSNVIVTYDGGVKLVDFGVAKVTAEAEVTRTGMLKGKLSYMSPEQCNNEPVDRRSDVFALGVLLFELTTQTRLFRADSDAGTMRLVSEARVPPPSSRVRDYPTELEPVVLKALACDRNQRHATARELQLALDEVARARGLVLSSAALGEWLTATFGHKPEPWIGDTAPEPFATDGGSGEPVPAPAPVLERGPVLAPLPVSGLIPTGGSAPKAVWWRRRLSYAAALGLAALASATVLGLQRLGVPGRPAPLVVTQAAPPMPPPAPPSAPAPPPKEPAPIAQPAGPSLAPAPAREPARPAARKPRTAQHFAAAFARRENELLRCFARFAEPGAATPQLAVSVRADVDGRVIDAKVLPPEVAGTALGSCVAEVAANVRFGPQPTPVLVRIPVTVRRVGATEDQTRAGP